MASPIFNSPKAPRSTESLAQEEIRALLKVHRRGDILVVAADTHPGIFEHALSRVQTGENLTFRARYVARIKPTPKIYLTRCRNESLSIKSLLIKQPFPINGFDPPSLEDLLLIAIEKAFLAIGFEVVKGIPDRYHREWVI